MNKDLCHYHTFMESFLQCELCLSGTLCVLHSGWAKRLTPTREAEENERLRIPKESMRIGRG